jgi:hypothetical protein
MALLSGAMRTAAITGSSRPIGAWMQGRQWGSWGDQWVEHRQPGAAASDTMTSLERLHAAGVIDDAELARLRARVEGSA